VAGWEQAETKQTGVSILVVPAGAREELSRGCTDVVATSGWESIYMGRGTLYM
jgi:hypothetical protein